MICGIFGGTFDPPHRAHALAILWALQSGQVDRVLVIPAARHPFGKQPGAAFGDRVAMCRLMTAEFASGLVEVLDLEADREGPSYTVDTVRELASARPDDSFRLIAGTDIFDDLAKWREADELARLAPPLEVPRIIEGASDPARGPRPGALPMLSSTEVRRRLGESSGALDLLPARVAEYIRSRGLYGTG